MRIWLCRVTLLAAVSHQTQTIGDARFAQPTNRLHHNLLPPIRAKGDLVPSIGIKNGHSHNLLRSRSDHLQGSEKSGPLRFIEEGGHVELTLLFSTGLPQQPDQDTACNCPVPGQGHGKPLGRLDLVLEHG